MKVKKAFTQDPENRGRYVPEITVRLSQDEAEYIAAELPKAPAEILWKGIEANGPEIEEAFL